MCPDRELTKEETTKFISETPDNLFRAIDVFQEERSKPSLHDLCLLELIAITEGQKRILIQQGKELRLIKAKLREKEKQQ